MPKVYFSASAEFTIQRDNPDAETFVENFNAGKEFLGLSLDRVPPPYGSAIAFFINPQNLVDGEFTARAITKNSVLICMRGIFFIEPKSAYVDMALEPNLLWIVGAAKVKCGVRTVKYKDYYGSHTKKSLEVLARKSLKDLRSVVPSAALGDSKKSIAPAAKSFEVCGKFIYVQCAKISPDLVEELVSGELGGGELEEIVQSSPGFFSLYGASPKDVTVKMNGAAKHLSGALENLAWVKDAHRREDPPSEMFLSESFCLTSLPRDSKYVLIAEELVGCEEYQFRGKYSEKKFSAHRVILEAKKGVVLADVIQVKYEKSKIRESTESHETSVFILENGILRKIR